MDTALFWQFIDNARIAVADSSDEKQDFLTELETALLDLEEAEVAQFHTELFNQFARTYHWDLVAAAVVIYGLECDDLDIDGFRAWLISRGEEFLNKTLQNVDSLGEENLIPADMYWPELLNLPADIYEQLTGDRLPDEATPAQPEEPAGEEFQVKDLPERLPELVDDFAFFLPDEDEEEVETSELADDEDDEDLDAILADVSDEENPFSET